MICGEQTKAIGIGLFVEEALYLNLLDMRSDEKIGMEEGRGVEEEEEEEEEDERAGKERAMRERVRKRWR